MPRVVLIHWNRAEGEAALDVLRRAGADAELLIPKGGAALRVFDTSAPDAFVIDLTRSPSQGRAVGIFLRGRKSTRRVPLIFAGGEPEKVEVTRGLLPDAGYTEWARMAKALRSALHDAPATPVAPEPMAEYRHRPLVAKLGIKPGTVVALFGAPPRFERKLEPLPEGTRLLARTRAADRVLLFVRSQDELAGRFHTAATAVQAGGGLWILWPKQAARVSTDLTQPVVRRFAMDLGWVDYKICSVDETWSGLLFTRRG